MTRVRVIALGNELACDDGAALEAARRLSRRRPALDVVLAGRPGPGLLDLLDADVPTVLLDVVRVDRAAGHIVELALDRVAEASVDGRPVSSHALGVGETLRLAAALGRPLPRGIFIGIAGRRFGPGETRDPDVDACIDDLVDAAEGAVHALGREP